MKIKQQTDLNEQRDAQCSLHPISFRYIRWRFCRFPLYWSMQFCHSGGMMLFILSVTKEKEEKEKCRFIHISRLSGD